MLTSVKTYLARQARKPSGWFGQVVAPRLFNKENREMEDFGLELMDPDEDDAILEIGFGNGRLISAIMPHVKRGMVGGIDISEEMVGLARQLNKRWLEQGKLDLQHASIAEIPYGDATFDKAFTANTIYFWPEPEKNLREVKRVLRPGGSFFCALRLQEQMEETNGAFKNSVVKQNRDVFAHLYNEEEVKHLFEEAGFNNVVLHTKPGSKEKLHVMSAEK